MHYMRSQETDKELNQQLLCGEFGIEKESLRVDEHGYLAVTEHPKLKNDRISRDFSESQVEFISGVYDHPKSACGEICMLQKLVEQAISNRSTGKEYLWTYSNPPLFQGEAAVHIAEFEGETGAKTTYREYLAEKYGKVKMLFSGVHLNFSMPEGFFVLLDQRFRERFPQKSDIRVKNEWYVRLADVLMSDSWLLVALTAASPVADDNFLRQLGVPEAERGEYASFRNSRFGYWNLFDPELSYADFSSYLESVDSYVANGELSSIQELYYPIRLKPAGENTLENLRKCGVNHIELRMLDLNPMCCAGVAKRDLVFIHLLIAYRAAELLGFRNPGEYAYTLGRFVSDKERLRLHRQAARFSFWEENPDCKVYALSLLADIKEFMKGYLENGGYAPAGYDIFGVLDFEIQKVTDPKSRYADRIKEKYQTDYIGARMKEILEVRNEEHIV